MESNIVYRNKKIDNIINLDNNISNNKILEELQDHMFSSKNLIQYTKYKVNNNNESKKQNQHSKINNNKIAKPSEFFEPTQKDSLFWCFYAIHIGLDKYEMLYNQHFVEEKKLKFQYIELIRTNKHILKMHKIKPLSEIEDDLANKDQISIKTFVALCILHEINVMIIHKHKYYQTMNNDSPLSNIIYRRDEPLRYYMDLLVTHDKMNNFINNYYKMTSLDGGLKSMSSYKSEELIEICNKLAIYIQPESKKKTKKELYEIIILNF